MIGWLKCVCADRIGSIWVGFCRGVCEIWCVGSTSFASMTDFFYLDLKVAGWVKVVSGKSICYQPQVESDFIFYGSDRIVV